MVGLGVFQLLWNIFGGGFKPCRLASFPPEGIMPILACDGLFQIVPLAYCLFQSAALPSTFAKQLEGLKWR
jgi:hypothetical protein